MSKIAKISISVSCIIVVALSVFFGCFYGIKLTVTLDCGYYGYEIYETEFYKPTTSLNIQTLGYNRFENEKRFYDIKVTRGSYYSPKILAREGYTFLGWYKDTSMTIPWINGVDRVKSNITLYAKWKVEN